jgi:hypothetical protein
VAARERQVEQLGQVQRLLAFTELAALTANHRSIGGAPPRVRRRWADVRRGARAARCRAASMPHAASNRPLPLEQIADQPAGAPPTPLHLLKRDGDTVSSRECGKTAARARWSALAYGHCSVRAGAPNATVEASWERIPHRIAEADGAVRCTRCRGSVPAHRRAAFVGRRCPAWWAAPVAVGANQQAAADDRGDWGAWIFALLGHQSAGLAPARAASAGPRGATQSHSVRRDTVRPTCTRARMLALLGGAAWQPHAAASGPRLAACLRCGASAPAWGRLAASPCGGWVAALPPRVAALVLIGSELHCAGGSPGALAEALHRRMSELPAVPD